MAAAQVLMILSESDPLPYSIEAASALQDDLRARAAVVRELALAEARRAGTDAVAPAHVRRAIERLGGLRPRLSPTTVAFLAFLVCAVAAFVLLALQGHGR